MGILPAAGEILDQALVSYVEYVRAGFEDAGTFERIWGDEPPVSQLEQWDLNREMSFRIAWKPYMYNPTLPHLLGGVRAPALVVWGREDRIVPVHRSAALARAIPHARLRIVERCGHIAMLEQPGEFNRHLAEFLATLDVVAAASPGAL
jgi:pimeloyl-ACP methyl ester carboxylesterase